MGEEILTFGENSCFFERCRYWENIISKKISSVEENYKYFIGDLHNDHKVKTSHIMLKSDWACM